MEDPAADVVDDLQLISIIYGYDITKNIFLITALYLAVSAMVIGSYFYQYIT